MNSERGFGTITALCGKQRKHDEENIDVSYDVTYEISGVSMLIFEKESNEEVLEENENSIKVKAKVENEFFFIQRLLLFGADFRIISPDFFREKLISKIKLIQKGYK